MAGNGTADFSGDGGSAIEASLKYPHSVFLDKDGNIFISDMFNFRIRKVSASTGIIETVAGNGNQGFSGDGGLAINASISTAQEIHLDNKGNIYFADFTDGRVRKVDGTTGIIETIAGNGNQNLSGDGGLATEAGLAPSSLSLTSSGTTMYIADQENNRIRMVTMSDTFHAAITSEESLTTNHPTFDITLSFNRIATCFDVDDLTLFNAVAGEISTLDTENFVVAITPKEPGLVEVMLAADKV